MALKNFKNIINNKAYFINSKDREIFEKGDLQSFFGISEKDAIEFIVYDINDNQLPQGDYGLVRYIPMTSENIADYFMIADGTIFQAYHFPNEYFIDIERLLAEAGYTNGIFKTQVNLINHRVGSNDKYDKLWINEISPSRTEIRLLPLKRKETEKTELFERYDLLMKDGEFKEDTIAAALALAESISPIDVANTLNSKWGKDWVVKLKNEYGIVSVEAFLQKVHNTFVQSAVNEFTNRISDPFDLNFGKPKKTKPKLELSINNIKKKCSELYIRSLDYYLARPVYQQTTNFNTDTDPSKDIVEQVLRVKKSDAIIGTTQTDYKVETRIKDKATNIDVTLKKEIEKQLPPPTEEPTTPPPPPPPPSTPKEDTPKQTETLCYEYTYRGFSGGTINWIDCDGVKRSMYTEANKEYKIGCAKEGVSSGLGQFIKIGECGKKKNDEQETIVLDYNKKIKFPEPTDLIITPDGLPNIQIKDDVVIKEMPKPQQDIELPTFQITPTQEVVTTTSGGGGTFVGGGNDRMGEFGNPDSFGKRNEIQNLE